MKKLVVWVVITVGGSVLVGVGAEKVWANEWCGGPPVDVTCSSGQKLCAAGEARSNYCDYGVLTPDGNDHYCAATGAACDPDGLCSNGCGGQVTYYECISNSETCGGEPPDPTPTPVPPGISCGRLPDNQASFETGVGWVTANAPGNVRYWSTPVRSGDYAWNGSYSLKSTYTGGSGSWSTVFRDFLGSDLPPVGQDAVLTGRYLVSSATGDAAANICLSYQGTGIYRSRCLPVDTSVGKRGQWQEIVDPPPERRGPALVFERSGSSETRFIIEVGGDGLSGSLTLYLDGLCLKYGSRPGCSGATIPACVNVGGGISAAANGVQNVGYVNFPAWDVTGGQNDDLRWYEGVNAGGGTWRSVIPQSEHPNGNIYVDSWMFSDSHPGVYCGGGLVNVPCPTNTPTPVPPTCAISLSPSPFTLVSGGSGNIVTANVTPGANTVVLSVTFETADGSIASVSPSFPSADSSVPYQGWVSPGSAGQTYITGIASIQSASGLPVQSGECRVSMAVTVLPPTLTPTPTPVPVQCQQIEVWRGGQAIDVATVAAGDNLAVYAYVLVPTGNDPTQARVVLNVMVGGVAQTSPELSLEASPQPGTINLYKSLPYAINNVSAGQLRVNVAEVRLVAAAAGQMVVLGETAGEVLGEE